MTQSKKIAVTGGIGSGKSTLLNLIKERGYPVFSCDEVYRSLRSEEAFLNKLKTAFPDCALKSGFSFSLLSKKVFSDRKELDRLNSLSHPEIMNRLFYLMKPYPVAFAEVPLLFEGGYETLFNGVITVLRNREKRIRALMLRDGLSEQEIDLRIQAQIAEREYTQKKCILIENNGTEQDLLKELLKVLHTLGVE